MDTFLPPIEHPHGLTQEPAYNFTQKEFGKVLTPLKVHSARLPSAFGLFYARIGKPDIKKLKQAYRSAGRRPGQGRGGCIRRRAANPVRTILD
jgi:hypothetical protein